ncbi:MAG: ornithine cyclodeaminase family protein [Deltaproteobacteria bacterium]|nr:ornithine cyclodeaminase family protein [Deltaproteobacteria bacterium]
MSSLRYLSRKDVEAVALQPLEMLEILETAFRAKGSGRVELPPKPGVHPKTQKDAFIHAMPCYVEPSGSVGMKWVSGYPDNVKAHGLPYISGLIILNDAATGLPTAVLDCTWITAERTAVASLLSARYLARKEPTTLGIVACGVQGESHLRSMTAGFPTIRHLRCYDVRREAAERLAAQASQLGLEAKAVDAAEHAVREMEIVVTSGPILKSPSPALEASWLAPGVFVSAVDFDSYVTPEAQMAFARIFTDDRGQMEYYRKEGYFRRTPPVAGDLGDLVVGRIAGRIRAEERLCAMNLGVALEDVAVAPRILERAIEKGIGVELPL